MSNISTFGSFTMAKLAIYASQNAISVTGNNIANINTPGYTRQALDLESMHVGGADRYASKWDVRIGNGVLTTGVSQMRDPYLDIRYRNEMSNVGAMEEKLTGLHQLSAIFDEVGKGDGNGVIELALNDLLTQLEYMATEGVGKDDYDTVVRSKAAALASHFNTYAGKLNELLKDQETAYNKEVDEVNQILEKIQTLNIEIRKSEIHGGPALELRDQRNELIDDLASHIKINVTYEAEDVGAGETVDKLVITLASNDPNSDNNNAVLVDGKYITQLYQVTTQETDKDGNPVVDDQGNPVMTQKPYYDLILEDLRDQNGLNKMQEEVYDPATGKLVMENGIPKNGVELTDNDLYGSLQSSREMLTEEGEYTTQAALDRDPGASTKRGIPYYQHLLDAMARKFAEVMNDANTMKAEDVYEMNGNAFVLKDADGNITQTLTAELDADGKETGKYYYMDGADKKYVDRQLKPEYAYYDGGALFSNNGNTDDTDGITAANIAVSHSWSTGSVKVLQSKEPHDVTQSTDQSNIRHMISLLRDNVHAHRPSDIDITASEDDAFFKGTFPQMLTFINITLGNDTNTTTSKLENFISAANDLYEDKQSVSGVDLNDEAMSMMQYNKSYSAACRLLTTIDEMLDKLINGTAI